MQLKSLQIQGFKSFPDKTELTFGTGLTAVVGPNGSGKSNISDAVRWVLGEQSTRSLRGEKMEDVIFLGTSSRKPTGFASVALTIDNTDRQLAVDADEVTIARRLYRSGESEYRINKTAVRLKDVTELLMDTGLGRDGYSIIGQGRIEEIVSSKPTQRREIFEEAAGISKYRYRKAEAEKKLESAYENLLRLRTSWQNCRTVWSRCGSSRRRHSVFCSCPRRKRHWKSRCGPTRWRTPANGWKKNSSRCFWRRTSFPTSRRCLPNSSTVWRRVLSRSSS